MKTPLFVTTAFFVCSVAIASQAGAGQAADEVKEVTLVFVNELSVKVRTQAPYDAETPLQVVCYFKHNGGLRGGRGPVVSSICHRQALTRDYFCSAPVSLVMSSSIINRSSPPGPSAYWRWTSLRPSSSSRETVFERRASLASASSDRL
jgi:hypothetical protein